MRYFWIGALLLAMLLLVCWFSTRAVCEKTTAVLLPLGRALEADARQDAEARNAWIGSAENAWREGLGLLSCLLSHSYTREISEGLGELRMLSGEEFRRSCRLVRSRLQTVAEMDLPVIGNIF